MANLNYNKLALNIFGEMAFENAESPIADTQQFITVLENLLNACEPEYKTAVVKALSGEELSVEEKSNYAIGLRYLKHPAQSGKLRPFLNNYLNA